MTEITRLMVEIIVIGIGATFFMDLIAVTQKRAFGIPSLDYALVGRWILHMRHLTFYHSNIITAQSRPYERLTGWLFHYVTGIVIAGFLVFIQGATWVKDPSLAPCLLLGLISVVLPFLIMQPAFGFGIAASRTPNPPVARVRSLTAHVTFGVGLYISTELVGTAIG